jgi:hypothetical protein
MKRLIFIHSLDPTTRFLIGIPNFLEGRGNVEFDYIAITEPAINSEAAKEAITNATDGSTIVFLGHGASHCTYLPYSGERATGFFINKTNFHLLAGKNFICLACRSAEFINGNLKTVDKTAMIGFDDLPTHWQDVSLEREMVNPRAYEGITDKVLANFREMLVSIFAQSLYDAVTSRMDFHGFYLRLRLYTNRLMFHAVNYSISDNPSLLANILYEFKTGIQLLGYPAVTIL